MLKLYIDQYKSDTVNNALEFALEKVTYDSKFHYQTLFHNIEENFDKLPFECFEDDPNANENTKKLIAVRRVVITPSRIELNMASLSVPNRAIRTFYDNIDDFLRISFLNENHTKGMYTANFNQAEDILMHVQNILENGFQIGSKTFKFLHYSNSQMKNYSCWFMNEDPPNLTYEKVIKELGNFDKEVSVSKNASRRGQAFSSAVTTVSLDINKEIEEYDDIIANGYEFTDGCGEIDPQLLKKI